MLNIWLNHLIWCVINVIYFKRQIWCLVPWSSSLKFQTAPCSLFYISLWRLSGTEGCGNLCTRPKQNKYSACTVHTEHKHTCTFSPLSLIVCSMLPKPPPLCKYRPHSFVYVSLGAGGSCERLVKEPDMLKAREEDMNRGATGRQPWHKRHSWCYDCAFLLCMLTHSWIPLRPLGLRPKRTALADISNGWMVLFRCRNQCDNKEIVCSGPIELSVTQIKKTTFEKAQIVLNVCFFMHILRHRLSNV